MRIVMTTDSYLPSPGGVVTGIVNTKKALEDRGHEVIVIAPDPGKEELREDGTIYFPAWELKPYPGYFVPIYPSNKMEVIRGLEPDIIHSQGQLIMGMRSMLACRNLDLPLVVSFNTMVTEAIHHYSPIKLDSHVTENLLWFYLRTLLQRADAVITLTDAIGKELIRRAPHIKRMETIPLGIDTERFHPDVDGSGIRRRHGIEGRKVVVHVGRMSYEKNIDMVIDAMTFMDKDTVLLLVGSGPSESKLRRRVSELRLEDRVVFTGYVPISELNAYYAAGDASVIASKFETQGLVVVEAMACGVPVAAIDYRALRDTVIDGFNGRLFQEDAGSCAAAIQDCIDCDGSMRRGARETAERHSIHANTDRLIELYEYAIDKNHNKERPSYYRRLQDMYDNISLLR